MLVNARADGNPECNEYASEADQTKGTATGVEANLQHSRYEGVDSEKLISFISAGSHTQRQLEKRHTKVIRATPTSPICLTRPCAVQ